jgi:hypothetical protein
MTIGKHELMRRAIVDRRPVYALYRGRPRIFCPYQLGAKGASTHVLVWQYDGESPSGILPQWRCFDLARLSFIRLLTDPWVEAPEPTTEPSCIDLLTASVEGHEWTRAYVTGRIVPIKPPALPPIVQRPPAPRGRPKPGT